MGKIVGRTKEQKYLERIYNSRSAEFVTLYGRRRVGKTFLISEFFSAKECRFMHVVGVQGGNMEKQLQKFAIAFSKTFFDSIPLAPFKNWEEALGQLHQQIEKSQEKVVIFLDELPWLATRKSGLLQELTHFWNQYWARIPQVILVVCGSSASWMIQKIIYNKGGLHNRTTLEMRLMPFTLLETKKYLENREVRLSKTHINDLYMALGGIPYYLNYVEVGKTAQENIQRIYFDQGAPLGDEFSKLFDSLFDGADAYRELIRLISQKKEGIGRALLKEQAKLSTDGGYLTKRLQDLCDAGFIKEYVPWGRNVGDYYKLIDEFCLFYLHWVDGVGEEFRPDHWVRQSHRPAYYAWAGYAFEAVCLKHSEEIIYALDIRSAEKVGSWRFSPRKQTTEDGAQVDLVIDRSDNAITLCEMKYTEQPFAIDKEYAAHLQRKIDVFKRKTRTTKQIFFAMISAHGLKPTLYSQELITAIATLEDLFNDED